MDKKGKIIVIFGCMYSGKTEEVVRFLRRSKIAKEKSIAFRHKKDTRISQEILLTRNKEKWPAQIVNSINDVYEKITDDIKVIAFDEGQFFEPEIIGFAIYYKNLGKKIIIAGLDLNFRGEPYHPMPSLITMADKRIHTDAICMKCGLDGATRTQRIINGQPAPWESPTDLAGGFKKDNGLYEARCENCFVPPQPPFDWRIYPKQ